MRKPQAAAKPTREATTTKPAAQQAAARKPVDSAAAAELLAKGSALEQEGNFAMARQTYAEAATSTSDTRMKAEAYRRLGNVNMKILFSPAMIPEKTSYVVRPGDRLETIAKKYGTTAELIAAANNIANWNMIRAGDELRVLAARFSLEVTKSRHEMVLFLDSAFCKRYDVGIGAFDKTPAGEFVITTKQENPVWYRRDGPPVPAGDEKNILGARWMSIQTAESPATDRRGLGIHGTRDETTIGKSLSAGCIRLRNRDVEELYTLVPVGTRVKIVE